MVSKSYKGSAYKNSPYTISEVAESLFSGKDSVRPENTSPIEPIMNLFRTTSAWERQGVSKSEPGFYYHRLTGAKTANASTTAYHFALTGDERNVRLTATVSGASTALAVYLDEAGVFIGSEFAGTGTAFNYVMTEIEPPANARKVIVSVAQSMPSPISEILKFKDTESKLQLLVSDAASWAGIELSWVASSFYSYSTGAIGTAGGFKSAKFEIPAKARQIRLTSTLQGSSAALAIFFDAADQYLGYYIRGGTSSVGYVNEVIPYPPNTKFIALSVPTGSPNATAEQFIVSSGASLPAGQTYWSGKAIVWFGTSIPAGGGVAGDYPSRVASALGATVYNEAVGSSMARNGLASNRVPETDPYGWSGQSWTSVSRALSGSLAEKNYLISNWAAIRTTLTGSPPATLTADNEALFRDCSYETKLARHLGINNRDLYVFDHGRNDYYASASAIDTLPADTRDRGTFLGAMNFLIDYILASNPKARICIISHYEIDRTPALILAQQKLAAYWSFPFCELHRKLGWSQQTVVIEGSPKTMTEIWMPDNVHPYSDLTGKANDLVANSIIPFIRDIR